MCLPGLHFSVRVPRDEFPRASETPEPKKASVESGVVSQSTVQQSEQLTSAAPRTRSGVDFFSGIKLLKARIAENLLALIYTGRLRNTLVENFKKALQEKPVEGASLEEKNLWWDKVYLSRNDLLDIGCDMDVIKDDLKNSSLEDERGRVSSNCDHFSTELHSHVHEISNRVVLDSLTKYYLSAIKGNSMAAHSCLKQMERLFAHMEKDGVVVRKAILNSRHILNTNADLSTELENQGFASDEKGRKKIDSMLEPAIYKIAKAAAPFKNRQVFLPNVKGLLTPLSKLNNKSSQEDFKCVAECLITIVSFVTHESEFDVVRDMVSSSLAKLKTPERTAIKTSCTLKDSIMAKIDNEAIHRKFSEAIKPYKNCNLEKVRGDVGKTLAFFGT